MKDIAVITMNIRNSSRTQEMTTPTESHCPLTLANNIVSNASLLSFIGFDAELMKENAMAEQVKIAFLSAIYARVYGGIRSTPATPELMGVIARFNE